VALDSYGIKSGFGVDFENGGGADRDDGYMVQIDERFEDDDLTTGRFRKVAAQRYYWVPEDE